MCVNLGIICKCHATSSLAVFFTLLFGYLGQFVHNGRILAWGALAIAVASLVMALPHFLSDPYQLGPKPVETCLAAGVTV